MEVVAFTPAGSDEPVPALVVSVTPRERDRDGQFLDQPDHHPYVSLVYVDQSITGDELGSATSRRGNVPHKSYAEEGEGFYQSIDEFDEEGYEVTYPDSETDPVDWVDTEIVDLPPDFTFDDDADPNNPAPANKVKGRQEGPEA